MGQEMATCPGHSILWGMPEPEVLLRRCSVLRNIPGLGPKARGQLVTKSRHRPKKTHRSFLYLESHITYTSGYIWIENGGRKSGILDIKDSSRSHGKCGTYSFDLIHPGDCPDLHLKSRLSTPAEMRLGKIFWGLGLGIYSPFDSKDANII